MSHEYIVNFSEPRELETFLAELRGLKGKHRIEICQHRPRRSDRQNRWYWPCFVKKLGEYLREQGFMVEDEIGAHLITDRETHEYLKRKFLLKTIIDPKTGEVIDDTTLSTTELSTVGFNEYLDNCAMWLAGFGIVVPDPGIYHEKQENGELQQSVPDGESDARSAAPVSAEQ